MPTATVNGVELYYEERGSGPPLLLMHGTGAYADLWNPVLDGLARTYRVIAYDRRGFGRSSSAPRQGLAAQAKDAVALLKALGAAPAAVVGWSGGGVVALDLAASAPECVSELFLAEPAAHMSTHLTRSAFAMQTRASVQRYLRRSPGAAAQTMYRWASGSTSGGNTFDTLPEAWRDQMTENGPSTVREMDQLLRPFPSRKAIRSIACPVTILEGELSDPAFKIADAFVKRLIPHAKVISLPGAAHFLHIDQPQLWVDAITPAST
ncbi:pimeloyl-ACP methyl ester carboxylesterase [Aeromicrobium panaciterrae]|uniref:Pimeloyl-ACP methyl ester carboxylesterase n=1 Tax=Aeromicrobium panaciterrae TaxID=363861 RepID=A0ABU1UMF1_9ACTN|nr:alpha/beta hydrolase [Aeromicrobium panaciterrae]MDR7086352.1 pimeloyl-ACP methyl ester carboxylesterase [Aeromicrobium panaciterrae]